MNLVALGRKAIVCWVGGVGCWAQHADPSARKPDRNQPSAMLGFVTIDAPSARATIATAINSHGVVVGRFNDSSGPPPGRVHGFRRFDDGTFEDFELPGATSTILRGINDAGAVCGAYQRAGSDHRLGFVFNAGVLTDFEVPGARITFAFAVNNSGVVVGQYTTRDERQGAWKFDRGVITDISVPGTVSSYATSVNDRGMIVGISEDGAGTAAHGWILADGVYRPIDVPSTPERGRVTDTKLDIILDDGTMAGVYGTTDGVRHGFVMTNAGCVMTVDVPIRGVREQVVRGMNRHGDIVGRYVDSTGRERGYLWRRAVAGRLDCDRDRDSRKPRP